MSETLASFPAPGKLNLMLRVVGRRADGYHLLQTVFRFIDLCDTLSFRVRSDGVISSAYELPGVPPGEDLAARAAGLLQQAGGTPLGADIFLEKCLPMGGGLGGGSSDAATTLIALNRLWGLDFSRARLLELAVKLGADVPVFVFGNNAFGEGIGERLTVVQLPPAWYVVLVPPIAVSTAAIFAHPKLKRDSKPVRIQSFSADGAENDLQPVVCQVFPEVARHLAWLEQYGAARLTGSGACVFASFPDEEKARKVMAQLPGDMKGFVARGLDHHPLRDFVQ